MNKQQQQLAARSFAQQWAGRGDEKSETHNFWIGLLHTVFGVENAENIIEFEKRVQLGHTSFIDAYIENTGVLIEQKSSDIDLRKAYRQSDGEMLTPFMQAHRYAARLPRSQMPRWIITCNFKSFLVYDMEQPNSAPQEILLENLEQEFYRLSFIAEKQNIHLQKEMELSIKAGEIVGKIYDKLLAQYKNPDSEKTLKSLNMLCVRLVFCLYAEDAGIFRTKSQFHDFLESYSAENMRDGIIALFKTLDTKEADRDPEMAQKLLDFPYVNGGLFTEEDLSIPQFSQEIKELLMERASADFDWSEISPTIFGAVFESTLNPETRRSGGMHYTSIENIHKVIDPLFLDELQAEFDDICTSKSAKKRDTALLDFQKKLGSLRFLDPACGSGNFLTETYLSLRRLENRCIKLRLGVHGTALDVLGDDFAIRVKIGQFYGIEINDFAAVVAKTALWIAESQMMAETAKILGRNLDFLPLRSYSNIVEGNALQIDWATLSAVATPYPSKGGEPPSPLERAGVRPATSLYPRYYTAEYKQWKMLKEFARDNRKNSTEAEKLLWQVLRNKQLGVQFRRQHAIDIFIADFICIACKLIVEVDGDYHNTPEQEEYDQQRTYMLETLGYKILRFTNDEIINNIGQVVSTIKKAIAEANNAVATPYPSEGGESPSPLERAGVRPERAGVRPEPPSPLERVGVRPAPYNYIMGNPPFVGGMLMTREQKEDMQSILGDAKGVGEMDYVCAWYRKALNLIKGTDCRCAFVSTNSICQGQQAVSLWEPLFGEGLHIDFAYRTFRWDSEASLKAHVHCVIVGFSCAKDTRPKYIFTESGEKTNASYINAYLSNAKDVFVESKSTPLCDVPPMNFGSMPRDGGGFILTAEEREEFIRKEPLTEKWIHLYLGAEEFIHNKKRYCLWLVNALPNELRNSKLVMERITAVRDFRLASKAAATRKFAETPQIFAQIAQPNTDYIIVPRVSSEKRRYIPIGFCSADIVASDAVQIIPNATLYHFGVLTSNVHMAWMRVVCGRLEMRYRYSKDIVYNNFPWCTPTEEQQAEIMRTAQAILDARAEYLSPSPSERVGERPETPSPLERAGERPLSPSPLERAGVRPLSPSPSERDGVRPERPCSLADLYDEVTMPLVLRRAHQANDRAVMRAYGFPTSLSESDCVARLFERYEEIIDN